MGKTENNYKPDYVSPPGETLRELLDERGLSQADLALRMGRPQKTISEIINGKAAVTTETALQLELVIGVPARFWISREQHYREHLARREQEEAFSAQAEWAHRFPLKELSKMGHVPRVWEPHEVVRYTLRFLGVTSPEQWSEVFSRQEVAFHRSAAFEADEYALGAWLRAGDLQARGLDLGSYDRESFLGCLRETRALTRSGAAEFKSRLRSMYAEVGVAVVFVPELPKSRVSGATRWLSPNHALIQLSGRYKTDDHLWFTFFHEAAHILLHGKRAIFLDIGKIEGAEEKAANEWAADFLIPPDEFEELARWQTYSRSDVVSFAERLGIAPGIVVGRLQHEELLPFNQLNDLKVRLRWNREAAA